MPTLKNSKTGETRQFPMRYQLMGLGLENPDDWEWDDEAEAAEAAAVEMSERKRAGEAYADTGVVVPFTKDDAIGLLQVRAAFELGVTATVIEFSNGQKLPMTPADFPAFAKWFAEKRNSFYID